MFGGKGLKGDRFKGCGIEFEIFRGKGLKGDRFKGYGMGFIGERRTGNGEMRSR